MARLDVWCKENGLLKEFESAYLRENNFYEAETMGEMMEKMQLTLQRFDKENVPLHDQLVRSFVFACTPQGTDFWWSVYGRLVRVDAGLIA